METPNETPPPSNDAPQTVTVSAETQLVRHRPWLAPLIASGVLLAILLILLIPRVLLYPTDTEVTRDNLDPATLNEAEASLEARAEQLRRMLETGVCVADGSYVYRDPELAEENGVTDEDLQQSTIPSQRAPIIRPPVDADGDGEPDEVQPDDAPASTPAEALGQFLDKSVVLVLAEAANPGGESGTGSGFFISDQLIVTNGHVAGEVGEANVYVINGVLGNPVPVEVVASTGTPAFGEPDFALLKLASPVSGIEIAPLADVPTTLMPVVAAGFPGVMLRSDEEFKALLRGESNRVPVMTKWPGNVTALQDTTTGEIVVHSAQITPGNSGGPLSDMCGRVTGVNTFIVEDEATGEHLYKALGTDVLLNWLSENGVTQSIDRSACDPASRFNLNQPQ